MSCLRRRLSSAASALPRRARGTAESCRNGTRRRTRWLRLFQFLLLIVNKSIALRLAGEDREKRSCGLESGDYSLSTNHDHHVTCNKWTCIHAQTNMYNVSTLRFLPCNNRSTASLPVESRMSSSRCAWWSDARNIICMERWKKEKRRERIYLHN